MSLELSDDELARQLILELKKQTALKERFDAAHSANYYMDEINLGEPYRRVTEFREDPTAFLVKHTPT